MYESNTRSLCVVQIQLIPHSTPPPLHPHQEKICICTSTHLPPPPSIFLDIQSAAWTSPFLVRAFLMRALETRTHESGDTHMNESCHICQVEIKFAPHATNPLLANDSAMPPPKQVYVYVYTYYIYIYQSISISFIHMYTYVYIHIYIYTYVYDIHI